MLNLPGAVHCQEALANLGKVEHVRPEDRSDAVDGRLEHVLSAVRRQAAPDVRDVRYGVGARQLAHRVEQQHTRGPRLAAPT